ncbi:hypothetical protein SNEBB_001653 [Seison nebaliae]|nr:hypothetical protein SNEBB_001653 [Seison nebaliae]
MKFLLIWFPLISTIVCHLRPIAVRLPLKGEELLPGQPWPKPYSFTGEANAPRLVIVEKDFDFEFFKKTNVCDIMREGVERYKKIIFSPLHWNNNDKVEKDTTLKKLNKLLIVIDSDDCPTNVHIIDTVTEAYTLNIGFRSELRCKHVWGCLRGLETFSQLIYYDLNHLLIKTRIDIADKPRYAYRGVLYDSVRHFKPMSLIKKEMDTLQYNKFNKFHWHLTDDQSIPIELPSLKDHQSAAYTPDHRYTKQDIIDLVAFARLRGIEIIPEIESPGHFDAIGKLFPEILTKCFDENGQNKAIYDKFGKAETLNPIVPKSYEVMENLIRDISQLFPTPYIHLGMDEAYLRCWKSNPQITSYREKNNLSLYQLLAQYAKNLTEIAEKFKRKVIFWGDGPEVKNIVPKSAIVNYWGSENAIENVKELIDEGYDIIFSSAFYVDHVEYGQSWKKFYNGENMNFNDENYPLLGGQLSLWSEYIDGSNELSFTWPIASSVSERLWAPKSVQDETNAMYRLDEMRCRLLRRGIPAKPILNGYCDRHEAFSKSEQLSNPDFNYDAISRKLELLNDSKKLTYFFCSIILPIFTCFYLTN